jgi:uncharacterized phage protein (TIGR01671 family)
MTIKFRAWNKQEKKMFPVSDISFGDDGRALTVVFQTVPKGKYYRGLVDGENGILMQFTGLKDRHGEEIYEDDVVIWDGGQYTVTFSEHDGAWILKDDRDDWECPSLYGVSSPKQSRIVIIGNIHQPKEDKS